MDTLTRSASIRDRVKVWREAGGTVALIPTVGTLHKGHMSLVAEAQERADHVIVSSFTDPPHAVQTFEADRELLTNVGADLLFVPPVQEIFPIGRARSAVVSLPELADVLEGAARPGDFAARTTVLVKLFNLLKPDIVLFGERDLQLLVMVRRLVDDLFLSIDVVGCPTFRDDDGLAFATLNRDLSAAARLVAPRLYVTLSEIAALIDAGERDYEALQRRGAKALDAAGFVTEYFAIRQASDLGPVRPNTRDLAILAAASLGSSRLRDNLRFRLIDRY